ncbi:MAG: 5'-nucleotidase [Bacteroidales bacterium]|nr:5'-nucleotidase [Bacteroidales bacterium]
MNRIKSLVLVFLLAGTVGFAQKPLELQSVKRTSYQITSQYDSLVNPKTVKLIEKYKKQMSKQMNEVIGVTPVELGGGIPESLLLNLTADVMREIGSKFTPTRVDVGFMNDGGLRNTIRKGNITVGNIFEVYPFDNQLVVLSIKGKDLKEAFDFIAQNGGAGVSGATLKISDSKVTDLYIGASTIQDDKIYTVATIDYLADGNDGMIALKKATDRKQTGLLLRDVMLDYVRSCTKAGKAVTAKLDGRITVMK